MSEENKCQICGLRLEVREYPSPNTIPSEGEFKLLHKLQDDGIIEQKFLRNVFAGGQRGWHEFCVIDSDKWNKNSESCPWWQLKIGELGLPGHVSIYNAQKNADSAGQYAKTAHKLMKVAIFVSSAILILGIIKLIIE